MQQKLPEGSSSEKEDTSLHSSKVIVQVHLSDSCTMYNVSLDGGLVGQSTQEIQI